MHSERNPLNSWGESKIPIRPDSSMNINSTANSPLKSKNTRNRLSMIAYPPSSPQISRIPVPTSSSGNLNSLLYQDRSKRYSINVKQSTNIYSSNLYNYSSGEKQGIKESMSHSQNLSNFSNLSLNNENQRLPKSTSSKTISGALKQRENRSNIIPSPSVENKNSNKSTKKDSTIPRSNSQLKFNYYTYDKQNKKHFTPTLETSAHKRRTNLPLSESVASLHSNAQSHRISSIQPTIKESDSISSLASFSTRSYKNNKQKIHDIIQLFEILCLNPLTKQKFEMCLNTLTEQVLDSDNNDKAVKYYAFEDLSSKRPDLFEKLTMYERIMQYHKIYFTGLPKHLKIKADLKNGKNNHGFDDTAGNYNILIGDHLKYQYKIESILGSGAFGSVVSVLDYSTRSKSVLACKIVKNDPRWSLQSVEEIKILKNLQHHNVVKYIEHFNFRSHMCIVTELLGVTLYESIQASEFKGFSLGLVKRFTKDILNGLNYLHKKKIIHCDLKPENLMVSNDGTIKIIDFGSSCHVDSLKFSYLQSRFYRSPEILMGGRYDTKSDIWSAGLIALELFAGEPFFQPQNEWELFQSCIEYLNIPSRQYILRLRSELKELGFIGIDNNSDNVYNTLLWKAFDINGGINMEYINRKLKATALDKKCRFKPGGGSLKNFVRKHIDYELSQTDETVKELNNFLKFIKMCLVWNKWGRSTASDCLKLDFFNNYD